MLKKRSIVTLLATLIIALIVSACGSPTPTVTPQPAATLTTQPTTAPAATVAATQAATSAPATAAAATSVATTASSVATSAATSPAATSVATSAVANDMLSTAAATSARGAATAPSTAAAVAMASTASSTSAPVSTAVMQETAPATKPASLPQCAVTGVLQVGSDASYPPFESVNEKTNKIEGFDVDLVNAIGKKAGFTVNYHNALFDTIFTALSYGQYDLVASASTITEERQKTVSFSKPYFRSHPVLIVRQADSSKLKGPADLAGKTLGAQLGTTGAEAAKKVKDTKGVKEYPTAPDAYQALANGDVDGVVDDTAIALNIIANRPELKLVVVGQPLGPDEFYGLAVRKDCAALLTKVNKALGEAIADGTYAKIYEQYFGEAPTAEFRKGGKGVVPTAEATAAATKAK